MLETQKQMTFLVFYAQVMCNCPFEGKKRLKTLAVKYLYNHLQKL